MGMGVLPGFPTAPFLIIVCSLGLIGYALWSNEAQAHKAATAGGGAEERASHRLPEAKLTVDTAVKGHKVIQAAASTAMP